MAALGMVMAHRQMQSVETKGLELWARKVECIQMNDSKKVQQFDGA
jgi:hypothetical protein